MAILPMYAIKDVKAGAYSPPLAQHHVSSAKRQFAQAAANSKTLVSQYPADFELWFIGDYNDVTGQVTNNLPEFVMTGIQAQSDAPKGGSHE